MTEQNLIQLEQIVDVCGLADVLDMLAGILEKKAQAGHEQALSLRKQAIVLLALEAEAKVKKL